MPLLAKRPYNGKDVASDTDTDDDEPPQKRLRSCEDEDDEKAAQQRINEVCSAFEGYFREVNFHTGETQRADLVVRNPLKLPRISPVVWLPRDVPFFPFYYQFDTFYVEGKLHAKYLFGNEVWREVPTPRLKRPNTEASLAGVDETSGALLFKHPGGRKAPLTAHFQVDFGVPLSSATTFFPRLTPVGGQEQLRVGQQLYSACMDYLRKAITTYCLPAEGDARVFVKAGGWRSFHNNTVSAVTGKNNLTLRISLCQDPSTGNLALHCYSSAFNVPLALETLFTPVVLHNIGLVLETYTFLAKIPREFRLVFRRFAPQLDLVKKFLKEGDL